MDHHSRRHDTYRGATEYATDMARAMDGFTPNKLLPYLKAYAARDFGELYMKENAGDLP